MMMMLQIVANLNLFSLMHVTMVGLFDTRTIMYTFTSPLVLLLTHNADYFSDEINIGYCIIANETNNSIRLIYVDILIMMDFKHSAKPYTRDLHLVNR